MRARRGEKKKARALHKHAKGEAPSSHPRGEAEKVAGCSNLGLGGQAQRWDNDK